MFITSSLHGGGKSKGGELTAEELKKLWNKLSVTKEEDEDIVLRSSCTRAAREVGENCAVMKILMHSSINLEALRKKHEDAMEAK